MASVQVNGRGFTASWNLTAKYCDSCKSAPALFYCRSDSAFLCSGCDSKVHGANKLASRHERVWMCEVCEQAPASFTCKADAAALCVTCDRDIHSANPLARRHERFPVIPFYDSPPSSVKSNAVNFLVPNSFLKDDEDHNDEEETDGYGEEAEAASWILQNPNSKLLETPDLKCENYFFSDVDPCIDLDYASSMDSSLQHHNSTGTDSVVPVQNKILINPVMMNPSFDNCIDMDFYRSKSSFSYSTKSFTQSVSSSSLDFGVVPDGNNNTMADISNSFDKSMKGGLDQTETTATTANQASQLSGLDREARVLRYREKRKNRKFEKTIRYASRKAYAETRPRIKGRFAKRTEIEVDMDQVYSSTSNLFADSGYGIVPSF